MVTVDKATFAKLNKKEKEFEILVDAELAMKARENLKKGKDADLNDVLAVEGIFSDSKKGLRAAKKDLLAAFDTDDVIEVAKIILKEGKINATVELMHKEHQEKLDRITALISTNAIDAQTKHPIPRKTIEEALKKAMFRVTDKKVEDQLQDAIKAVKKIIPLTFESRKLEIKNIPANLVTPCLNLCKNLSTIERENWNNDRSLSMTVSVPAGLREELMDKLNAITHGNVEIKTD